MSTVINAFYAKNTQGKYVCVKCDFSCCKQSDMSRHLSTRKHNQQRKNQHNQRKNYAEIVRGDSDNDTGDVICSHDDDGVCQLTTRCKKSARNYAKITPNDKLAKIYSCSICSKTFKERSGLWRHSKKCNSNSNSNSCDKNVWSKDDNFTDDNTVTDSKNKELIMLLMKENNELKQMMLETQNKMLEVIKNGTNNTIHNNTNNTNNTNNSFNLQFFLNETCKDAMNIMDFVNSLQLQLTDLEKMGDVGYVNGITSIIIKSLKGLDVTERPVHCTDAKRETIYVKDEDKWDKEATHKPKIRKAIKQLARKNAMLLQEFKEKYPDCIKSESKHSDRYTKLMVEAMGGKGCDDEDKENKIIKRLAKEVTIETH